MKKISIFLSLLMAMMVGLTSCDEDFAQPPMIMPEGGMGSGAWDNPMTALQVNQGASGTNVWVTGYIVGWIDTSVSNAMDETTCKFTTPCSVASNMLMALTPDETDYTKCIPVQLVSGTAARKALNLTDNPNNLKMQVTIYGNCEKYFSHNGVKSVSDFNWGDKGIEKEEVTPDPSDPSQPDQPTITHTGSWDNPYTMSEVIGGAKGSDVWVTGYIVGWINTATSNAMDAETCTFTVPATGATNLLMADSPTETNVDKCVPIQLPAGDIRSALNLVDNAGNLGKQVTLKGNLEKYFGHAGVKSVTAFNWGDKGVQ